MTGPALRGGRGVALRVFTDQTSEMLSAVNSPAGQCQQVRAARASSSSLAVMGRLVAHASMGQHQYTRGWQISSCHRRCKNDPLTPE